MPESGESEVRLASGRLTVLREMPFGAREFETACRRLLLADAPELVIDLTRLKYMASTQVGALIAACARAAEAGRVLRVLIGPGLERFLGRARLDGGLHYEVVGPGGRELPPAPRPPGVPGG
jgi:hypothetical protein